MITNPKPQILSACGDQPTKAKNSVLELLGRILGRRWLGQSTLHLAPEHRSENAKLCKGGESAKSDF